MWHGAAQALDGLFLFPEEEEEWSGSDSEADSEAEVRADEPAKRGTTTCMAKLGCRAGTLIRFKNARKYSNGSRGYANQRREDGVALKKCLEELNHRHCRVVLFAGSSTHDVTSRRTNGRDKGCPATLQTSFAFVPTDDCVYLGDSPMMGCMRVQGCGRIKQWYHAALHVKSNPVGGSASADDTPTVIMSLVVDVPGGARYMEHMERVKVDHGDEAGRLWTAPPRFDFGGVVTDEELLVLWSVVPKSQYRFNNPGRIFSHSLYNDSGAPAHRVAVLAALYCRSATGCG